MPSKQIHDRGYRQLVATLKATRKEQGLTQAEVAARLGVCRTWVSKIESCEVGLDLLGVIRLCRAVYPAPHARASPPASSSRGCTASTSAASLPAPTPAAGPAWGATTTSVGG